MSSIILVDEKEERQRVRRELVDAGHRVIEASDGGKAIQMANGDLDPLKIDAIIIDSQVPKIYGVDAVTYFRFLYPDFPLIAILNSPDVNLANYYLEIGVQDLLIKPIEKSFLLKAVHKVAVRSFNSI